MLAFIGCKSQEAFFRLLLALFGVLLPVLVAPLQGGCGSFKTVAEVVCQNAALVRGF